MHPELTERDLLPVRDLIDEVRTHEQQALLLAATITWLNAFSAFKKVRRRYGLPTNKLTSNAYGMVLSDLKTTGKALMVFLERGDFSLNGARIDQKNFEACVRELSCDDIILDLGLLTDDLSDVERALVSA